MPIKNLTHNMDGSVRLRRSITTKLAIGLPPGVGANFPQKLDHFVFQRKVQAQVEYVDERGQKRKRSEVVWQVDEALQKFYGERCKEVWIVLLDDDADVALRTELAWWTKTQRQCFGDGEVGTLKLAGPKFGEQQRPCANHGCNDWASGICKPSGDLYFMLADFPSLGTICKLHTTSFQSITEIRTALEDLRSVTGGRLMGVRVKLTVRIEKNVFADKKKGGAKTTSTKHVLGLQLDAADVRQLAASLTENVKLFADVRKQLGARSIIIDEDPDTAVAPSLAAEFYPAEDIAPARPVAAPEVIPPAKAAAARPVPQSEPYGDGTGIGDDDLPAAMYAEVDTTPWPRQDAQAFYAAWKKSGHDELAVRKFMKEECKVDSSLKIPLAYKNIAMKWANRRAEAPPPPPQSDEEKECRQIMGLLSLNLSEQMQIIEDHGSDWAAVKAELQYIADHRGMEG